MTLIISCEHGGNQVPAMFSELFNGKDELLNSHKGYDLGTGDLFDYLLPQAHFGIKNTMTRLLIEFNRSEWSKNLFSSILSNASFSEKEHLIRDYYRPYREKLIDQITHEIERNYWVLHLSLHSFTPQLETQIRNSDIGILYDPSRPYEKLWASHFKQKLKENQGEYTVRMNYPYLGKADGLTTYLRKRFSDRYLGIELEINQKWVADNKFPLSLKEFLAKSIQQSLIDF